MEIKDDALTHSIKTLSDKNPRIRSAAIFGMISRKYKEAVPYLIKTFQTDTEKNVRISAILGAGLLNNRTKLEPKQKKTLTQALNVLLDDKDEEIAIYTASALAMFGVSKGYKLLLVGINRDNKTLRSWSVGGLGCLRQKKSIKILLAVLLNDKIYHVREMAARALFKIGGNEAMAGLSEALKKEPDNHVRETISKALDGTLR